MSWPALAGTCWRTQHFSRVHSPPLGNSVCFFPQEPTLSTQQEGTSLGFCILQAMGASCGGSLCFDSLSEASLATTVFWP